VSTPSEVGASMRLLLAARGYQTSTLLPSAAKEAPPSAGHLLTAASRIKSLKELWWHGRRSFGVRADAARKNLRSAQF